MGIFLKFLTDRLIDECREINKFNEEHDQISPSSSSINTSKKKLFVNNLGILAQSESQLKSYQSESVCDERQTTINVSVNSREDTRKSSLASMYEEGNKLRTKISAEKLQASLFRLFTAKRIQYIQYAFSRLQLYFKQAHFKITRVRSFF